MGSRLSERLKWVGIIEDSDKPLPKWLFILLMLVVLTVVILVNK